MIASFKFPAHGEVGDHKFVAVLAQLEREAVRLDSMFRLPGTGVRFGLDPIIGILPLVGDVAGAVWGLRLISMARRLGAEPALLRRMVWNVAIDFLIGLAPFIGPLFDVFYRSNMRNLDLLLTAITTSRAETHAGLQ